MGTYENGFVFNGGRARQPLWVISLYLSELSSVMLQTHPCRKVFPEYDASDKPCFIGHYWLSGDPEPLAPNVACLDYSVAKNGKLVAYRWSGESQY